MQEPLFYRKLGSGPPVVLLHGLFGSAENLGVLARGLSEDHTVYSFDLPNHGRSPHGKHVGLIEMAEWVGKTLDDLAIQKVTLVGHSLGGKVAMELALSGFPADKLVVIDIAPVAYQNRHDQVFQGLNALTLRPLKPRSELDNELAQYVEDKAVRSFLLKNLVKEDNAYAWRMNLADLERSYPQFLSANREGQVDTPILFLKGGASNYIREQHRDEVEKRFRQPTLKVLPGLGHWLHAERPDQTLAAIRRFLD